MNKTATYEKGERSENTTGHQEKKKTKQKKKQNTKVKNQLKQSQQIQCNPRHVFLYASSILKTRAHIKNYIICIS